MIPSTLDRCVQDEPPSRPTWAGRLYLEANIRSNLIDRKRSSFLTKLTAAAKESVIPMDQPWTAVISQDESWWVGWIAEVPGVNAQERTRDELLESLADLLREALEMNRRDAVAHMSDYEVVAVAV